MRHQANGIIQRSATGAELIGSGRVVEIGGLPIGLRARGAAAGAALAELATHLLTHRGPPLAEIVCGPDRPPVPRRPADRADGPLRLWWASGRLRVLHESGVAASVRAGRAELGGSTTELTQACHQMFPLAVAHLLAPHGRHVLHAAAVRREDRTILLLGASGSGKSTLVLGAMLAGWEVLSDDLVVVRAEGSALVLGGIARPLSVPADVAGDDRGDGSPALGGVRERRRLVVTEWNRAWSPVSSILVADHGSSGSSRLVPLEREELLRWLLFSFLGRDDPGTRRSHIAAAAELAGLPARRWLHGTNPAARLQDAAALLTIA